MGSLERKLKRNKLRKQFDALGKSWSTEKNFQQQRLANGEELQKDEPKLGTKPSFGQFIARTKYLEKMKKVEKAIAEKQKEIDEKKIDLEWKED